MGSLPEISGGFIPAELVAAAVRSRPLTVGDLLSDGMAQSELLGLRVVTEGYDGWEITGYTDMGEAILWLSAEDQDDENGRLPRGACDVRITEACSEAVLADQAEARLWLDNRAADRAHEARLRRESQERWRVAL